MEQCKLKWSHCALLVTGPRIQLVRPRLLRNSVPVLYNCLKPGRELMGALAPSNVVPPVVLFVLSQGWVSIADGYTGKSTGRLEVKPPPFKP